MLLSFKLKYVMAAAMLWLAGCAVAYILLARLPFAMVHGNGPKFSLAPFSLIHTNNIFLFILANNCIVALFLSALGFFTGGLLTAVVNMWNGIFFGLILFITAHYTPGKLWVALLYGPFELPAFFLFSAFGFEGFAYLKKILSAKAVHITLQNLQLTRLWLPGALLLVAAVIETLTIKYL
jgi:uncharacterized membrane protein SpoIIM required for sporulation